MAFEQYKHFLLGENHINFPNEQFIIKLNEPRVYIRFNVQEAFTADFDEFFNTIAEVQFIDGVRPSKQIQNEILRQMFNFLCIEERLLDEDLNTLKSELNNEFQ